MGYTWVIKEGFNNGEKINFQNNSSTVIIDKYNDQYNGNPKLYFSEKGKVRLPGINSIDIYAKWNIENNKLIIELDSAKYNYIHRKIDSSEISNKDVESALNGNRKSAIYASNYAGKEMKKKK